MASFSEWAASGLALLGAFGGVSAIAWFVAKQTADYKSKAWLQTHKGELDNSLETHKASLAKELESHKASIGFQLDQQRVALKRQEMMFDTQLRAAQELTKITNKALNQFAGSENDDGATYLERLASNLSSVDDRLTILIEKHEVGFSEACLKLIRRAKHEATVGGFSYAEDCHGQDDPNFPLSAKTTKHAEELANLLRDAIKQSRQDLKEGIPE